MIVWAPVFHFYQPPTQFPAVLKKICHESYRPLIELLGEFERARATVNINGSLTQMLIDCGHQDVINGLRQLAEVGRIELLGSAMYHPDIQQRVNLADHHRHILEAPPPESGELRVVKVTDLLDLFPAEAPTAPRASSWSTSGEDLARGVPYPLWNDPSNHVQALLWRHLRVCLELVELASRTKVPEARPYVDIARGLLDRALHICQFWWASRRPMWDLNMVERGLAEQRAVVINAMKAVTMSKGSHTSREAAEDRHAIAEDLGRRVRRHLLVA